MILLYILIRNFFFVLLNLILLNLIKGWGKVLDFLYMWIGDDIECFRLMRNKFVYVNFVGILEVEF